MEGPSSSGGGLSHGLECPVGLPVPEVSLAPGIWPTVGRLDLEIYKEIYTWRWQGRADWTQPSCPRNEQPWLFCPMTSKIKVTCIRTSLTTYTLP